MRLLVVTAAYPCPSDPQRAVFIENQCRALLDQGVDVSVVAPRIAATDPEREVRHAVPVVRFVYPSGGRRLKETGASWWRLMAYHASGRRAVTSSARATKPDLILGHWIVPTGPLVAASARAARVPYALWAHGSDVLRYARGGVGRWLARRALSRARRVFAVSMDIAARLRDDLGVPSERIRELAMGVGPEFDGRVRDAAAPSRTGALRVVSVADLIEEKGVRDLAAAARRLADAGHRIEWRLIGDGPLHATLGEAAAGLDLVGRRTSAQVAAELRDADIFVHPSWSEGASVALMEALASSVPVVATDVGAARQQLRNGEFGWLVPPRRPDLLADAVARIDDDRSEISAAMARIRAAGLDLGVGGRTTELRRDLEELLAS